jgi:hypothetical protein
MTSPLDPTEPDEALRRRIAAAAQSLDGAADRYRRAQDPTMSPSPAAPPHRGPRRPALTAAAIVLVLAGIVAVAVAVLRTGDGTAPAQRIRAAGCGSGVDLIAADQARAGTEDAQGVLAVAVNRSDATTANSTTWLGPTDQVMSEPSWSPTGTQIAVTWADGDYESGGPTSESIWVVDVANGNARPITFSTFDSAPAWSPDGSEIAYLHRDADGADSETVRIVPSQGGAPRTIGSASASSVRSGLAWLPDGSLLRWSFDRGDGTGGLVRIAENGDSSPVGDLPGPLMSLAVVPGGRQALLEVSTSAVDRSAMFLVDLGSGDLRRLAGAVGTPRWSLDGRRLYLLEPTGPRSFDDRALRRARFDGSSIDTTDTVAAFSRPTDVAIGPCAPTDGALPRTAPAPDRPLIGTTWRLGASTLEVNGSGPLSACGADCMPVEVVLRPAPDAAPCVSVAGDLVGAELRDPQVTPDDRSACEYDGWMRGLPPERFTVDGDLLTVEFAAQQFEDEPPVVPTRTYGAAFVGDPGPLVEPLHVVGPTLESATVTTSTVPLPAVPPCTEVETFGRRLAATHLAYAQVETTGSASATSPRSLAEGRSLVVQGRLVASGFGSLAAPATADGEISTVVYELVVERVLSADEAERPVAGSVIGVTVPYVDEGPDDPMPPDLGVPAPTDLDPNYEVPEGRGVPVVAFLDRDGGGLPDDWLVAGPAGLAVGCPGRPMTGLVGTGPAWTSLADLGALIAELG